MFSEELSGALLTFFFETTVSSAIIETLHNADKPLAIDDIQAEVQDIRMMELPRSAVESSLLILAEAGLVSSNQATYDLTPTGKELAGKLTALRKLPGN